LEDSHHQDVKLSNDDVGQQMRIILKASQQYQSYVEQAKSNLKFADTMNLIDATEFLKNGEIEYRNAKIQGLENAILNEVNVEKLGENMVKYINYLNIYTNRICTYSHIGK